MNEKILGGIFGLCVADAIGVPVEFNSRETLARNPVNDMYGYGTYNQPPGTWSDDTSMTLCLMDSLTSGLDYSDIMRKFQSWVDKGEYTPHGEVFDIGIATRKALQRFTDGTEPLMCGGTSEYDNGNGSLMRILPLAFYLSAMKIKNDEFFDIIHDVSALTHAHKRSQIACGIYLSVAMEMLGGRRNIDSGITAAKRYCNGYYGDKPEYEEELEHFERIFSNGFEDLPPEDIKSSGYVVHTLEAALWCLLNTDSYESCVLKAVNLGDDTDTVAAVAGGLAGILYGIHSIPDRWLEQIARFDYIKELCGAFHFSLYKPLYKSAARKLCAYIPYLENIDPERACKFATKPPDAISTPIGYDYEEELLDFIEALSKSKVLHDPLYIKTPIGEFDNELIQTENLEFLKTMISWYLRAERFCDGVWAGAVKSGAFLAILRRLEALVLYR